MANIAEALVATAVGLLVAIPAVAAFNWFQRQVKTTLANTDALAHVLLAHLKAEGNGAVGRDIEGAVASSGAKADRASRANSARGRDEPRGRRRDEVEDDGGT